MRVVLVIPGMLSLGAPLAGVAALGALAAWAGAPVAERAGLTAALLAASGVAADAPPAPLAARGAGLTLAAGDVQFADPVTLVPGRDDVLFAGRVDDLARADADALVALLAAHFAADGLAFHAPRPDAWFVASHGVALAQTTALAAVDGAIAAALPRGPHAKPWRRWLSEMQMLLHEHPVNARREAAGRPPVTGIWPWGGGPVAATPAIGDNVYAAAGADGDVARGLAASVHPLPSGFAQVAPDRDALVVLPRVAAPDALPALARDWLAPLAAAVRDGAVREAVLVADDPHAAFTWVAQRPSGWRRLRARFAAPRFTLPAPSP